MRTVLSLGGNIGDVIEAINHVAEVLPKYGLSSSVLSPMYRTSPVGCEPGTPDFINAVIVGYWPGTPNDLLQLCHKLECDAGRPSTRAKNSPRVLDIDIILFGNEISHSPKLTLPHPQATERLFVIQPLCDVAPEIVFPDSGLTALELLEQLRLSLADQEQIIQRVI